MIDQIISQVLGDKKGDIIAMLISKLGVNEGQAGGFLGSLVPQVLGMLKGGKLDVASLMGGDTSVLKSGLDLGALGGLLGGGKDKAEQAIDTVAGPIAKQLGGLGDLQGLLGQLGDVQGMLDDGEPGGLDDAARKIGGGLMGKVFGGK